MKTNIVSGGISNFLSVKEAANYLSLSQSTVYKMSAENVIPKYKKRGKVYFKASELEAWIESGRVMGAEEIAVQSYSILHSISSNTKGGYRG